MKTTDINKYFNYKLEDFLQDNFFISSVNSPTEETVEFWEKYRQTVPLNINEYENAKLYIESIPVNESQLSEDEISGLWNLIDESNIRSDRSVKRRKRYIITGICLMAACITGIMFILPFFNQIDSTQPDIYAFADQSKNTDSISSETQLILSENKTITLDDKESVITYDSENIKVSGNKDLSKQESSLYNQLIVPKGKRSMLTLSDGTKIWVNAGTRVVYPVEFNKKEREIYIDGEIYIQVAHNNNWPFVVKTKDVGVKVLGTEFNVTAYEKDPIKRIVLVSGSINIVNKDKKEQKGILLTPDEMYEYSETSGTVKAVDVDRYISWKDGIYMFYNENLAIIMERLSHYYGEDIMCDEGAASLECSGKLDLKSNLEDVLKGLSHTAPITYLYQDGKMVVKLKP